MTPETYANTDMNLGTTIYKNLTDGWDKSRISAVLGNTYVESEGWSQLKQKNGGPGRGIFMMEAPQRKNYQTWLQDQGESDNHASQVNYVQHLFDTKHESLKTPWDRLEDNFKATSKNNYATLIDYKNFIKSLRTEEEAKKHSVRSAWNHQNYTTQQAWDDWESGNLERQTKAFEALFERAGVPHLDKRIRMSKLLHKNLHMFK